MGQILLENMLFHAFHGVFEEEQTIGNTFEVNLKIDFDFIEAAVSDNLDETINYQLVYDVVKREMSIKSQLIEHVAGRILKSVLEEFPQIKQVEIKLSKINPPLGGQVEKVSVVLAGNNISPVLAEKISSML